MNEFCTEAVIKPTATATPAIMYVAVLKLFMQTITAARAIIVARKIGFLRLKL